MNIVEISSPEKHDLPLLTQAVLLGEQVLVLNSDPHSL